MSGKTTVTSGPPPDYLDGDMTPRQLAQVLAAVRFERGQPATIEIDRHVRDFFLRLCREVKR
jgi:hypothetical protein